MVMEIYLAYNGGGPTWGELSWSLIGAFQNKDMAIKAIEDSIKDIDDEEKDVRKEVMHSGDTYWEDRGMYVGYLRSTDLL
jgi:hypothetical protein